MIYIIGASLAGDMAAATLRQEGYAGPILLIGDEPEAPYDRPPLSKEALTGDAPESRFYLRAESWYAEQGVELRLGTPVTAINPAARTLQIGSDEPIKYEKLLITTGARARTLPGMETSPVPAYVVRTLADARHLRAALQPGIRVAIVGAGVIGMEVAASASTRGCHVTVVDFAGRVMSRILPPELSAYMAELHTSHGVNLLLDAGSVSLTPTGISTTKRGDLQADLIVIGIGVVPNTELAAAAGLACRDGIIVDEYCQTSDPDIYAAGDVTRYPNPFGNGDIRSENWKHAQNQAITAARNMLGKHEAYGAVSTMWSDQYDVKLQTAGDIGTGIATLRGEANSRKFMLIYQNEAGVVIGALGINQAKDMRFAQILVEKRAAVNAALLADPKQDLRKLAV
ncbi:aromatic hydrocarbons catabolism-related reductase [Acidocella aquatica]|uniref:Aromatic hydrocarbons catabolism-related reductase n=1 Tax=Acidocella aquatica TaxID=1922313 RepID=A0ABQ6A235_9PROT|nr:FAD-dependent oxidoreductase [Acidocella aquatica]GLR65702.1 aromatic hydrocarbons catabolism-related reductase [Acidocella aquatica]